MSCSVLGAGGGGASCRSANACAEALGRLICVAHDREDIRLLEFPKSLVQRANRVGSASKLSCCKCLRIALSQAGMVYAREAEAGAESGHRPPTSWNRLCAVERCQGWVQSVLV